MKKRINKKDDKAFDKVLKQIQCKDNALAAPSNDHWMNNSSTAPMALQNVMSSASDNNKNLQLNFDRLNQDLMSQIKNDPHLGFGYPSFNKKHSINNQNFDESPGFILKSGDSAMQPLFSSSASINFGCSNPTLQKNL